MTDIAKIDQSQMLEALAVLLDRNVQEVQGVLVSDRVDEALEEAEIMCAEVLSSPRTGRDAFEEYTRRLQIIRGLRTGDPVRMRYRR